MCCGPMLDLFLDEDRGGPAPAKAEKRPKGCPSHLTYNKALKVWTFNIPRAKTCPGKTEFCKRYCYAATGKFNVPTSKRSVNRKLDLSKDPAFVKRMLAIIKKTGIRIIRIHSSGDMYNEAYLNKWMQVARQAPKTEFFTYTRSWRSKRVGPKIRPLLKSLEDGKIPNFRIIYSMDPTTKERPSDFGLSDVNTSHIVKKGDPRVNCLKQLQKGASCEDCRRCFPSADPSQKEEPVFFEFHGHKLTMADLHKFKWIDPEEFKSWTEKERKLFLRAKKKGMSTTDALMMRLRSQGWFGGKSAEKFAGLKPSGYEKAYTPDIEDLKGHPMYEGKKPTLKQLLTICESAVALRLKDLVEGRLKRGSREFTR